MSFDLSALGLQTDNLEKLVAAGGLINGAVLITRVLADDGTHLVMTASEGLDWITRRGMITVAEELEYCEVEEGES